MPSLEPLFDLTVATSAAVAIGAIGLAIVRRAGESGLPDAQCYGLVAPAGPGNPVAFFSGLQAMLRPPGQRLVRAQPWIALEFVARGGRVRAQVWIPRGEETLVGALFRTAYPGAELDPLAGTLPELAPVRLCARGRLAQPDDLPIGTSFPSDPLAAVLGALADARADEAIVVQLLVRPKPASWQRRAHRRADRLRQRRGSPLWPTDPALRDPTRREREQAKAIEAKAASPGFDCELRLLAAAAAADRARGHLRAIDATLRPYAAANELRLQVERPSGRVLRRFEARTFGPRSAFILTPPELGGLWHLPTAAGPHLETIRFPRLAPPAQAGDRERIIGYADRAGGERPVGLSISDSRNHLHLLGPTGTGKSTALLALAAQDIAAGRGVAVLDPKGDLVHELLGRIPPARLADVILIAPDDDGRVVGINPLEHGSGDDPDLVAENTLTIFKRIYERSWGMRTDDILKSALLTLLRRPGSTLAHIPVLLSDAGFRRRALADLDDPLGLDQFWRWFGQLSDGQRSEATGPVLNKLRDFLIRPRLRRLLCQSPSRVNLRTVVDSGQILLADLSVGRWGATPSALIGSFLIAKLWQAALARSAIAEADRRDFFLYIDEFQQFLGISGPFADALAQARSLHLSLTIANQHLGQLSAELREGISSNARSRGVFQCGDDDAAALARQFAPLDAAALRSLPRFTMAVRLSIDGQTSDPFTLRTRPPASERDAAIATAVRTTSLRLYGRPIAEVDRELEATIAPAEPPPPGVGVGRPAPRSSADEPAAPGRPG